MMAMPLVRRRTRRSTRSAARSSSMRRSGASKAAGGPSPAMRSDRASCCTIQTRWRNTPTAAPSWTVQRNTCQHSSVRRRLYRGSTVTVTPCAAETAASERKRIDGIENELGPALHLEAGLPHLGGRGQTAAQAILLPHPHRGVIGLHHVHHTEMHSADRGVVLVQHADRPRPPPVRDHQFLVQFALQPDRQQILRPIGVLTGDVPADTDGVKPMQPLLPAPGGSLEEKDPIAVANDQVWDDLLQRRILLDVGAPAELTVAE